MVSGIFTDILHHFVLVELATSSIRVKRIYRHEWVNPLMLTAAKSGLANLIQYGKGMHVRNIFEGEMLIRTLSKTLLQIF